MFGYKNEDGFRGTIMLSHVSSFEYYDNDGCFVVFLNDGTDEPISISIKYYDDFKNAMFKYLLTKETK